jgi:hypothetical protein
MVIIRVIKKRRMGRRKEETDEGESLAIFSGKYLLFCVVTCDLFLSITLTWYFSLP